MDAQKLIFKEMLSEVTGKNYHIATVYIEELLQIRGGCKNQNVSRRCRCSECVFSCGEICAKLVLLHWLDILNGDKGGIA